MALRAGSTTPPAARPLVAQQPRPPAARAAAAAPLPPPPFWMAPAPLRGTPHPVLSLLRRANPAGLPAYRPARRLSAFPGSRPGREAAAPPSPGSAHRPPAAHRRLPPSTGQHAGSVSRWFFLYERPPCRRPPAGRSAAHSAARPTPPSSCPVTHPAPPPALPRRPPRPAARSAMAPAPPPTPTSPGPSWALAARRCPHHSGCRAGPVRRTGASPPGYRPHGGPSRALLH